MIVNGLPGWLTIEQDGLPQIMMLDIADSRIQALYVVRNPDKLRHLAAHLPNKTQPSFKRRLVSEQVANAKGCTPKHW